MRNQPKYHFFKNTRYALAGLRDVIANESSFKIELALFFILQLLVVFLPLSITEKMVLSASLFVPLIVEVLNSAIERVVDLVTIEHHELAKKAKDAGSAAVFLSITFVLMVWIYMLFANI